MADYKVTFHLTPEYEGMAYYFRSKAITEVSDLVQSKIPKTNIEFFVELEIEDLDVESDSACYNFLETIKNMERSLAGVGTTTCLLEDESQAVLTEPQPTNVAPTPSNAKDMC
ncbi:hypothetical protein Adt_14208 [Abeliophyllum distichum]|uniref:Uncharacterized protein n=1 Tax=Abeliophyllum distichum TaxID=126358 RepID=A0ABD1TZ17_9LAMI